MEIVIESIRVEDLKDTGSKWDPQDPMVTLKLGSTTKETERYKSK